jgi:pimeloyl-ACP methyl ester carboxylesterase
VNLAYDDRGHGEPVLFIAGQAGVGQTWQIHQVPAFRAAGYRVITFDNRGVGATANADGFTTATMVADTAELIERLDAAPVRLVAVSMGSYIAQELMLARPELVSQAALMAHVDATTARGSSFTRPNEILPMPASNYPPVTKRNYACLRGFHQGP